MAEDKAESGGKKVSKREKKKDSRPVENGEGKEPDFSDPEDYVDDISDEDLLGDLLAKKPKETDGIDSVIVVDNIPMVGKERLEKLQNVIRKIFGKYGTIQNEHFPVAEDEKTKGFIFLEYQNHAEAEDAVKNTNGYKLDKQHTFIVSLFTDFDKYADVSDEWTAPSPQPYKDHGNLRSWLMESHCYDQFSVIYEEGQETSIFLNVTGEPTVLESRKRWTETYVRWSPQGNLLATIHSKGIALWGGSDFKQIMKFSHQQVQLIDFSPCERYLVTFSPVDTDESQAIIIWDIRTGQKKRWFHCQNAPTWPIFKWSGDGTYFGRMTPDTLSVYETPSFGLCDKKSIKLKNISDFAWSPTDPIIAYWTPEERDTPARVTLIEIPSRNTLSVKNLFTVADCKIHWQKSGDYLCVKVDRYKSRKEEPDNTIKYQGIFHNFNVFRMREKEIPVDILEVKESVIAFAWEPVGDKFAIIHGESPRISVTFYKVSVTEAGTGSVELMNTFEKRQANCIFWSPRGQFVVLAGLRNMSGSLEFVDTSDMTSMQQGEHFQATDVEWDPTGRYVATGVSHWAQKMDNGFWLWNFQGRLMHKQPMSKFCQLLWRPRPPTLLSAVDIKKIKKDIRKFYPQFTLEDKMRESKASKEQIERRRKLMDDYLAWREQIDAIYEEEKPDRMALRDGLDTDEIADHKKNFENEVIEFLQKVEEKILSDSD